MGRFYHSVKALDQLQIAVVRSSRIHLKPDGTRTTRCREILIVYAHPEAWMDDQANNGIIKAQSVQLSRLVTSRLRLPTIRPSFSTYSLFNSWSRNSPAWWTPRPNMRRFNLHYSNAGKFPTCPCFLATHAAPFFALAVRPCRHDMTWPAFNQSHDTSSRAKKR